MTLVENKIHVFVKEDYFHIKSLLNELSPIIEIKKNNTDSGKLKYTYEELCEIDIFIFDVSTDHSIQLEDLKRMKNYNPDMKTILFTTEKNRKYRSYYLSRGVDFFIFKETESSLLRSILKQIHLRKTRAGR